MNLREFLSYKTCCPLCGNKLSTYFYSKKKQNIIETNDKLICSYNMRSLINSIMISYKVEFNFSLDGNNFYIDFHYNNKMFNSINLNLINKYKNYNDNKGKCIIYRVCNHCDDYNYRSNYFEIDLKSANIGQLKIDESFYLSNKKEKYTTIYELNNSDNMSNVFYYNVNNDRIVKNKYQSFINSYDSGSMKFSLIDFISKEKTISRLEKAVIFS